MRLRLITGVNIRRFTGLEEREKAELAALDMTAELLRQLRRLVPSFFCHQGIITADHALPVLLPIVTAHQLSPAVLRRTR